MTGLLFAKPLPKALDKRQQALSVEMREHLENGQVIVRSNGRCECFTGTRCKRRACDIHHLRYGSGRRRTSWRAENKLHLCRQCHALITQHILVPVPGCDRERADSVVYWRVDKPTEGGTA